MTSPAEEAPAPPRPTVGAVRAAGRFDPSMLSIGAGAVAAASVVIALTVGELSGQRVDGVTAGAGAMLVGVASRVGGGRPPLGAIAIDALVMALSTFAGAVTGAHEVLHLAVLAVWSLAAGMLVAFGRRAGMIGTQAIIAIVVFGRFSQPVAQAAGLAGLVLLGGSLQVVITSIVRWPPALRVQRDAVAAGFRALADFARNGGSTQQIAAAFDAAEATLAAPTLFGDPHVMGLRSLVSEGRRIRLELIAIGVRAAREGGDAAARAALSDAAARLDRAAGAIGSSGVSGAQLVEAAGGEPAPSAPADGAPAAGAVADRIAALDGQLRAVEDLRPGATGRRGVRPSRGMPDLRGRAVRAREVLRAQATLHSPAARHALRLAVIVPACEVLARHVPLQRSYWMVVAAATVLRPEFTATITRAAERMAGTFAGALIASAVVVGLDPRGPGTIVAVGVLVWAAYATFPASFAVGTAFLTATIVFLLDAVAPDSLSTAADRLLDTLAGGSIGLAAYLLWPTWSALPARDALMSLIDSQRSYLAAVLQGADEAELRPLARAARLAYVTAEATIEQSLGEPERRRVDIDRARALLAALRRLILAVHSLRLDLGGATEAGGPQLEALARGFDDALGTLAGAVGPGRRPSDLPPLRRLYDELAGAGEVSPAVLGELDEVVDAIDTAGALLRAGVS